MNCIKTRRESVISVVIVSALLGGCQIKPDPADTELRYLRGTVQQVGDQLLFTPCYEQTSHILNDLSERLVKRTERRQEPLFYAELSVSQQQQGLLSVHKAHLLGGGVATCRYELEGIDFRAAGEKPLWVADVKGEQITVHHYSTFTRHRFKQLTYQETYNAKIWKTDSDSDEGRLSLSLYRETCRDSHGTEYELRASMELEGALFSGCARRGSLDMLSLPGTYLAKIPEIEGVNRAISMVLAADGSATITQDYRNDQPLVVHSGRWQRLPKKRLVIYLNNIAGTDENHALLLQRNSRGALQMKGYNPLYGSAGLLFYPQNNPVTGGTINSPAVATDPSPD